MPNENVEISSLAMTVSDEPQTDSRDRRSRRCLQQ